MSGKRDGKRPRNRPPGWPGYSFDARPRRYRRIKRRPADPPGEAPAGGDAGPPEIVPTPEAVIWRAEHRLGSPPKVLRDSELRAFVDARIRSMTFTALAQTCRERFGPARAPGKTQLWAYFRRYARKPGGGRP